MFFDSLGADVQHPRHLLVGFARDDHGQRLAFAARQLRGGFALADGFGELRSDVVAASQDHRQLLHCDICRRGLRENGIRTALHHRGEQARGQHAGEHEHAGVRAPAFDVAEDFRPGGQRHGDVEEHQCRLVRLGCRQGFESVGGFRDDVKTEIMGRGTALQRVAQPIADDLVIIGDDNGEGGRIGQRVTDGGGAWGRNLKQRAGLLKARRLCIALAVVAANPAYAELVIPTPTMWDVMFYSASLTGMVLFVLALLVLRAAQWASYAVYGMLMFTLVASLDGMLGYVLDAPGAFRGIAPLLVGSVACAYGFAHAALRIERPHPFVKLRYPFLAFGLLNALLIPGYFLTDSLVPLYAVLNTSMLLMFVAQAFPPLTWSQVNTGSHRVAVIAPPILASIAVGIYAVHFLGPGFSKGELDVVNRLLFLAHTIMLFAFVVVHILEKSRLHELALRDAADAARRAAEGALELERAQQEYERVRQVAVQRSRQLAEASHDIRQPISALRSAVRCMRAQSAGQAAGRFEQAIDYLDALAGTYLEAGTDAPDLEVTRSADGTEHLHTQVLGKTILTMFAPEAEANVMDFRVRMAPRVLRTRPMALTRALSNLVANAMTHSEATKIIVTGRQRGSRYEVAVRDNGKGIEPDLLPELMAAGAKGAESAGSGLGLAIVSGLADEHGFGFSVSSTSGGGTMACLCLPTT